jgi:hypothetical protein
MDQIESRLADLRSEKPVILVCQAGQRAALCRHWLTAGGVASGIMTGGMNAWTSAGFPVVRSTPVRWAIERQVRLVAGLMVMMGVVLAAFIDPLWIWFSGFIGAGLVFAAVSGVCGMASVMAAMPWNQARPRRISDRVA